MRRPFRRHMISVFLQLVLLPLAVLSLLIMLWFIFNVQEQARNRVGDEAEHLASLFDLHISSHQQALETLARALQRADVPLDRPRLEPWLDDFNQRYPGILTMLIADPQGRVLAGSPSARLAALVEAGQQVDQRPYFRVALIEGHSYVSDAFQGQGFGNDPIVALSTPLRTTDGDIRGMLQAALNLTAIASGDWHIDKLVGAEAILSDSQDRIVAASDSEHHPFLLPVPEEWLRASDSECRSPVFFSTGCFTVAEKLGTVPWRVLVRQPVLRAYQPLLIFLAFVAAALAVAALVALLEGQRLAKGTALPLMSLAEAVEEAASRLDRRPELPLVPGASPREVALLHDAFEQLFDKLIDYNERLTAQLDHLEQQVERRTSDLKESRGELLHFLDQAPALILGIDAGGQILFANRALRTALGYEEGALEEMSVDSLLADPAGSNPFLELDEGETREQVSSVLLARNGRHVDVGGTVACLRSPRGELQVRAVLQDTTQLHEAEREAIKRQRLLDLLLDNAPVAMALLDRELCYLVASQRWLEDYGIDAERLPGRSLLETFPSLPAHWQETLQRCLDGEAIVLDSEPAQQADGGLDWVRWSASPWYRDAGSVGGLILHAEIVQASVPLRERLLAERGDGPAAGAASLEELRDVLEALSLRPGQCPSAALLIQLDGEDHPPGGSPELLAGLRHSIRHTDLLGRVDEHRLVVLMVDCTDAQAPDRLARRIQALAKGEQGLLVTQVPGGAGETPLQLLQRLLEETTAP